MSLRSAFLVLTLIGAVVSVSVAGEEAVRELPRYGTDSTASAFFRERYKQSDLVHWLDNHAEWAVYLQETTGRWDMPDELLFSVQGNPYRLNHYYIDGFRTDSRFHAGSTLYRPNMEHHGLLADTYRSRLWFTTDSLQPNYASLTGNAGGVGGPNKTTMYLIGLFHPSARERLYYETSLSHPENGLSTGMNPETHRPHIKWAGQAEAQYTMGGYRQHLYADFGERTSPVLNEGGIAGMRTEGWWKVQADGEIPLANRETDPTMHYLLNLSRRDGLGEEFRYNAAETMRNETYSASLYFRSPKAEQRLRYTAGMTWATNRTAHEDPCFARNIVDQDGEGFEPWVADGETHEFSVSATMERQLTDWLRITYDGHNSALFFTPTQEEHSNRVYWRSMFGKENYDLYTIHWREEAFAAGLLENTVSLQATYAPADWVSLFGQADFTLDGVLLSHKKSFVRPNWQGQVSVRFTPCKWFTAELTAGDYRMTFDIEHIKFFSDDYMNGEMRYADGTLFGTTGGKYHRIEGVWQPRYFVLDIPIAFRYGRHEIEILSQYKKFHDQWTVELDGGADAYGYYLQEEGTVAPVYFFRNGERRYVTAKAPAMGGNPLNDSPYFASNTVKYAYNGRKWYVSVSWQSYMMTSLSALGNGMLSNDVNILSETSANPNSRVVAANPNRYALTGRTNQDLAYILRLLAQWNITEHWQIGLTFKFKDGQPFTNFRYAFATDEYGHTQAAIWNGRTRGINPTDGNFGSRKDAFFDLDAHVGYNHRFRNGSVLRVEVLGYNLYDFATELTEFTFEENNESHRYAMSLCIPRGLMTRLKWEF